MGTAGSLRKIEFSNNLPILLTNGDVITEANYMEMLNFHSENNFDLTVAVKSSEWKNPYGVVQTDGIRVSDYIEKPVSTSLVNAGIYCLNQSVINLIDADVQFDMSELILKCLGSNLSVGAFVLHENWLDIGRKEDFHRVETLGDL